MGCVAENSTIQAALLASVTKACPETTSMIWPASVVSIGLPSPSSSVSVPSSSASVSGEEDGLAWLQLEDGRKLKSRLVVAADGGNSKARLSCHHPLILSCHLSCHSQVRDMAGISVKSHDYQQRGLVATVRTAGESARYH